MPTVVLAIVIVVVALAIVFGYRLLPSRQRPLIGSYSTDETPSDTTPPAPEAKSQVPEPHHGHHGGSDGGNHGSVDGGSYQGGSEGWPGHHGGSDGDSLGGDSGSSWGGDSGSAGGGDAGGGGGGGD